jgi:hypothetical protein
VYKTTDTKFLKPVKEKEQGEYAVPQGRDAMSCFDHTLQLSVVLIIHSSFQLF